MTARKLSQKERDRRIDAALAAGRYQIMSRYTANGTAMVVLSFCDPAGGPCDVCGADKPGGEGCFSVMTTEASLSAGPGSAVEPKARAGIRDIGHT